MRCAILLQDVVAMEVDLGMEPNEPSHEKSSASNHDTRPKEPHQDPPFATRQSDTHENRICREPSAARPHASFSNTRTGMLESACTPPRNISDNDTTFGPQSIGILISSPNSPASSHILETRARLAETALHHETHPRPLDGKLLGLKSGGDVDVFELQLPYPTRSSTARSSITEPANEGSGDELPSTREQQQLRPRLNETGIRKILGGWLDLPVVQIFINYFQPALRFDMLRDVKNVLEMNPHTRYRYPGFISAVAMQASEWNYERQSKDRNSALELKLSRMRQELSWNNYHYDGTPHANSDGIVDMNATKFGYDVRGDVEGNMAGLNDHFKALLRTKTAQVTPCLFHELSLLPACATDDRCRGCGSMLREFL